MVQMIAAEGHTAPAPTSVGQQGASNGTPIGDVGEAVVPVATNMANNSRSSIDAGANEGNDRCLPQDCGHVRNGRSLPQDAMG